MNLLFLLFTSAAFAAEGVTSVICFEESGNVLPGVSVEFTHADKVVQSKSDSYGFVHQVLEEGQWNVEICHQSRCVTSRFYVGPSALSELVAVIKADEIKLDVSAPKRRMQIETNDTTVFVELSGKVTDLNAAPIDSVLIFVQGAQEEARTGVDGSFSIQVPKDATQLVAIKDGYLDRRFELDLQADSSKSIEFKMTPAGYQLSDFMVSAPRIAGTVSTMLAQRQNAASVNEVLGAEQMSRTGDANAAAALARVTGLTVVGGKYVYVRGLGERYSASLLNGSSLPSPEPERRVVPLDLFPTAMLESITIQKSFSPDRPAEFGGGMISLKTRGVPDEPIVHFSVKGGYVGETTGETGMTGFTAPNDWTGFGTDARQLPSDLQSASDNSPLEESDMFSSRGYSADQLEQFGETVSPTWGLKPVNITPNKGFRVILGNGWELGEVRFGALTAGIWDNSWSLNQFKRNYFLLGENNNLEPSHQYRFDELENKTRMSGAFIGTLELWNQEIHYVALLNRLSSLTSRTYEGYNRDVGTDIRVTRVGWKEQSLLYQQWRGVHALGSMWELEWRYALSVAARAEPDRREYRFDREENTTDWYLSDRPEGNSIFYSTLEDLNQDFGLDLSRRFPSLRSTEEGIVKVGGNFISRDRGVDTRRFKYMHKGALSNDAEVLSRDIEDIFTDETIGPDGFQLEEVTRQTDNYGANQEIQAAYAMVRSHWGKRFSLMTGFRMEDSVQNVETFELFNPNQEKVVSNLDTTDYLPAVTATFNVGKAESLEDHKLRLGYGKTVSRPDFREFSPATFNDVTGGRQVYGEPNLKRAIIDNLDLRWEWYFDSNENLSIGAFYKDFTQPVESIVVVSAQHSVTYQNAKSAKNVGIELDFRKDFEFLGAYGSDFYLAGNAAWIDSEVQLSKNSGIQSSNQRPMQGQSPYVYNLIWGYDHPEQKSGFVAAYNVFGPRITEVGALGAPDYIEQPAHRIDCAGFFTIKGFRLSAKAGNLLDSPLKVTTGDKTVENVRQGRSYSARFGWDF